MFVGFLLSSLTNASSCCSLCQHGCREFCSIISSWEVCNWESGISLWDLFLSCNSRWAFLTGKTCRNRNSANANSLRMIFAIQSTTFLGMFWLFELPTVATALPTKPLLFVLPCRKNIEITQITWKQFFFYPWLSWKKGNYCYRWNWRWNAWTWLWRSCGSYITMVGSLHKETVPWETINSTRGRYRVRKNKVLHLLTMVSLSVSKNKPE